NISVAFAAFAFGITAGIGTVWMMLLNGLMMGVVGVACWREGMSLPLWSFVAAHGVIELPAIFIAGGAGLGIARGLLFPGVLSRGSALVGAGPGVESFGCGWFRLVVFVELGGVFFPPPPTARILNFFLPGVLPPLFFFPPNPPRQPWVKGGGTPPPQA